MVPLHPYRTKSQDYSMQEEYPPSKIGPFPYCYRTSLSSFFLGGGLNRQNLCESRDQLENGCCIL